MLYSKNEGIIGAKNWQQKKKPAQFSGMFIMDSNVLFILLVSGGKHSSTIVIIIIIIP